MERSPAPSPGTGSWEWRRRSRWLRKSANVFPALASSWIGRSAVFRFLYPWRLITIFRATRQCAACFACVYKPRPARTTIASQVWIQFVLVLNLHALDVVLRVQIDQQALRVDSGARGLARYCHRDGLLTGADTVRLHVRLAVPEHSDFHPVIHRRLSLDACFVDHYLAGPHGERHLPDVC